MTGIGVLMALALLYVWARDHARDAAARTAERQASCPHRPEAQRTLRVNSIIAFNPALLHRIIPGRRHLTKLCGDCGKQTDLYGGSLQPYEDFIAEYRQETIDREAQLKARTAAHEQDKAHAEAARLRKRAQL